LRLGGPQRDLQHPGYQHAQILEDERRLTMTRRTRALAFALLASVTAASSALAAHPTTPTVAVTSTLDGAKVLPARIRWIVHPRTLEAQVAEVDFRIDGKLRWREQSAPYVYGGDDNGHEGFLITTWLTPGEHRFTATVLNMKGANTADSVTARVLPTPQPPAALAGTWTRVVTAQDAQKAAPQYGGSPPVGRWKLVFDRVGAWELTPTGIGIVNEYDAQSGVLHVYAPIQMTPPVETAGLQPGIERFGHHILTSGGTDCTNAGPFGTYKWAATGTTLTLTAIHEGCPDRGAVWEGTWTRTT
jgi:hypothetical protein